MDPWQEEEHMRRLGQFAWSGVEEKPRRRGFTQQPRRRQEQALRGHVVTLSAVFGEAVFGEHGYTRQEQAALLKLSPRTLRQWEYDQAKATSLPVLLGRPVRRADVFERNQVIGFLDDLGPATGLPSLRFCFPEMRRAELEDLLRRYQRVWRQRHKEAIRVLTWLVPGRVWAMDFAEAPQAIDGQFPYLLAVRDLASWQQLLWQPVLAADAESTCLALAALFERHGAPLVLKSDNGSAFTAELTATLLEAHQVVALFSPPYYPRYNGSIEAGIGSLKSRTEYQAARQGRAGQWSWDDVAAAQAEANASARPKGEGGPSPEQAWAGRRPPTTEQRQRFAEALLRHREEERRSPGQPPAGALGQQEESAMERRAIQRALVQHGYLLFKRRRIPLPFRRKKVTELT